MDVNQIKTGKLRYDLKIYKDYKASEGEIWTVFDPVSDKYYRLHTKEYKVIRYLYSNHVFNELAEELIRRKIIESDDELKTILNFLRQSSLLLPDYRLTEGVLLKKIELFNKSSAFLKFLKVYLFFKLPLFDPDKFLNSTMPYFRRAFNKWTIYFIIFISASGYTAWIINFNRFISTVVDSINYVGIIRFGIALIFMKIIHELGHAYAAKANNVRVRKIGIFFMVFFPRLYIDLTDSWKISDRKQKMLIDSAGIIAEVVLGGIAALVWVNIGPGVISSISYYVLTVSVFNTIFVNGNPLIRYDGYYLLMDFTNIDNLRMKSILSVKKWYYRILFGIKQKQNIKNKNIQLFLIVFGIASYIYRLFLYTGIILIVYFKFAKSIGIVLMLIEVYVLILEPLVLEIRKIFQLRKAFNRKRSRVSLSVFLVVILIMFIPLPWNLQGPCEVRSQNDIIIFASFDGFLAEIFPKNGTKVEKGQKLFKIENPFLINKIVIDNYLLLANKIEYDQLLSDKTKLGWANVKQMDIQRLSNELKNGRRYLSSLEIFSPINGIFVQFDREMQLGKWLKKGEPIGEVYDNLKENIIAYFKEDDIAEIKINDCASISFPDSLVSYTGKVISINTVPAVFFRPSPLLNIFGGPLQVIRAKKKYELSRNYYEVEIKLDASQNFNIDRTGFVQIRKFSSVGLSLIKKIFITLNKEMCL